MGTWFRKGRKRAVLSVPRVPNGWDPMWRTLKLVLGFHPSPVRSLPGEADSLTLPVCLSVCPSCEHLSLEASGERKKSTDGTCHRKLEAGARLRQVLGVSCYTRAAHILSGEVPASHREGCWLLSLAQNCETPSFLRDIFPW